MPRTRVYGTIVYPESAPENWIDLLKEKHVQGFISPLHCFDTDPDGCIKKPHYHVMIMFDGVKSAKQWDDFRLSIGGVGTEDIQSTRGYARYLCHLDNPEKFQYNTSDVVCLGGSDYLQTVARSTDRYSNIKEMISYIRTHACTYAELVDYAAENNISWFSSLCDNSSYIISMYIKDFRQELKDRNFI